MTMSALEFLDQWFETDPLKATMSASGIIGTFQGIRSPGTAYVLLHHYMGEIDGAFRAWGLPRGGTGAISEAIAGRRPGGRCGDPDRGAGRAPRGPRRAHRRRRARERRGDRGAGRPVEPRRAADLPRAGRARRPRPVVHGRRGADPVSRLLGQGQPRGRRAARLPVAAGTGRAPARRDQLLAEHGLDGAGLRRRQVRALQPAALHRHGHSDARRSVDGAARPARHQLLRPVRARTSSRRSSAAGTASARRSATR